MGGRKDVYGVGAEKWYSKGVGVEMRFRDGIQRGWVLRYF